MMIRKYLVIKAHKGRYGWDAKMEIREREPRLDGGEIAVNLQIDIPTALFERPTLEARLVVPNEAVPSVKLTPQITTNVEKLIKEATGLKMVVSIVEPPKETDEK